MNNVTQTREIALSKLKDSQKAQTEATYTLILAELSEDVDRRRVNEEKAARRVRDANTALSEPQTRLATALAEVEKCQQRITQSQRLSEDPDLDKRIDGLILVDKYLSQLPQLQAKVQDINSEIAGLQHTKNLAVQKLEAEQAFIRQLQAAMVNPFVHPLAQLTNSYAAWRLPVILIDIISRGDRESKEWEICHRMLGELLRISGIRSEDYQLPDTGKIDVTEYMPSGNETKAPSAQEIMAQEKKLAENLTAKPTLSPEYLQDRIPRKALPDRPELAHDKLHERFLKP